MTNQTAGPGAAPELETFSVYDPQTLWTPYGLPLPLAQAWGPVWRFRALFEEAPADEAAGLVGPELYDLGDKLAREAESARHQARQLRASYRRASRHHPGCVSEYDRQARAAECRAAEFGALADEVAEMIAAAHAAMPVETY